MPDRSALDGQPNTDPQGGQPYGIRPVRPDEYDTVAALTLAAFSTVPDEVIEGGYRTELLDVAGRASAAEVLVAVDPDGRLLGAVTYLPSAESSWAEFDDPDAAGIRMLAVDPSVTRRGVGRALTVACIDRARAAGRRRMVLHSTIGNTLAQGMYERLGFRRDPAADWNPEPGVHLLGFELPLD